MKLVIGIVIGLLMGLAVSAVAQGIDYPVIQFTPGTLITSHVSQDRASAVVDTYEAGVAIQLYTPYVGGDARWWAATSANRDEWIAVSVNGYCPREMLGGVIVLP